jgi:glyoxylase-like metal-dependent hydrolase (beta-lactamase superfamily II)/ferredoxin
MADRRRAWPDNAAGSFFVDRTCIDCGTCQRLAGETFEDAGGHSRVRRQPPDGAAALRAGMALVACPTASIGTDHPAVAREAALSFPLTLEEEVSLCGYASEKSFGASSYFVERRAGNLLVDSPRAAAPLLGRLSDRGGVAVMVLSHRDDVADHAAIRRRFGCERVIHRADAVVEVERCVEGQEPVALADDLLVIPVPGHTPGSICLLYRETFLFTGDHLWWSPARGTLSASRAVNWYSWEEQVRSLEKLLAFDFRWVLPGHGRAFRAESTAAMRRELERGLRGLRAA